MTQTSPLLSTY